MVKTDKRYTGLIVLKISEARISVNLGSDISMTAKEK